MGRPWASRWDSRATSSSSTARHSRLPRPVGEDRWRFVERHKTGDAQPRCDRDEDRQRTAYHESDHALVGMLTEGADPVRKISIIPRGRALGVTFQSPENDRYGYSADYLKGRLIGSLGGRAAELLIYGDLTTGAESDLEQATRIARAMAGRWGMSDAVGPVSVLPGPNDEPMLFPGVAQPSERTRELVDSEARRILEECADAALAQLREHREQLEALARALLEREPVYAYAFEGVRHDAGNPLGLLRATVDFALVHPQLGGPLRDYLKALGV